MENEDAGEEEEMNGSNGTAGASKVQRGCQKGSEDEDEEGDDEEDQREDGDSSDDYSSLEGMDLRERARQKQEEERPGEKDRESKTEGAEEDLTSITLGEESKEGAEEDDVTELWIQQWQEEKLDFAFFCFGKCDSSIFTWTEM